MSNQVLTFNFNKKDMIMQCNPNDNMKDLFKRFCVKTVVNYEDVEFKLNGLDINEDLTVKQLNATEDKIKIYVYKKDDEKTKKNNETEDEKNSQNLYKNKNVIQSKDIICPECGDLCILDIDEYKIKLSQCNMGHEKTNILLSDFKNTQKVDESKILCGQCNGDKTKNDQFFKCNNCNLNLGENSKQSHDTSHIIIDYEGINYLCKQHGEKNIFYCPECRMNICDLCPFEHDINHDFIYLREIFDNKKVKKNFDEFLPKLNDFKKEVQNLLNVLKQVYNTIDTYYDLCDTCINRFDLRHKNYQLEVNLNNLDKFNQYMLKDIENVLNAKKLEQKFKLLYNLGEKMGASKNITIKYKTENKKKIRIFGDEFVKNNKNNCKFIFNDDEYELDSFLDLKDNTIDNDLLEIKLKELNDITDLSYMFNDCSSLVSLSDVSIWNNRNIINLKCLFNNCFLLEKLPDLSKLNTDNVEDISFAFNNCHSLKSLPDISQWNTNKVTNIENLFNECTSLTNVPDITKWNTENINNMKFLFNKCSSLTTIPDISKWKIKKGADISNMFDQCTSLPSIPNISNE